MHFIKRHLWRQIYLWLGVCKSCPAPWMCIGSGGRVAFTFPTKGWATVTENWVAASAPCYTDFYRKGSIYWPFTSLFLRDRETDACPQCPGLNCFQSLTAPPTVWSYITPSLSAGPLPAFIGLFLSFSTLALHPTDRCLSPQSSIADLYTVYFNAGHDCHSSHDRQAGYYLSTVFVRYTLHP